MKGVHLFDYMESDPVIDIEKYGLSIDLRHFDIEFVMQEKNYTWVEHKWDGQKIRRKRKFLGMVQEKITFYLCDILCIMSSSGRYGYCVLKKEQAIKEIEKLLDKSLKANGSEIHIYPIRDGEREKEKVMVYKTVTEMIASEQFVKIDEDKNEAEEHYDMLVKYGPTYEFDH